VLHNLAVLNVLARDHGDQHLLLLRNPLLHSVSLGEELVEREGVQKSLFSELGQFLELAVAVVDGGEAFLNGWSVAFAELFTLKFSR
jgi:hypothetical protein